MKEIDQYTKLYGVIGYPVRHSLSPIMHNAAFKARNINAVYLAFQVKDIKRCIEGIKGLGISGLSITIPHKEKIIKYLDDIDDVAIKIGAVNTVVNKHERLIGYNTDGMGAVSAIEDKTSIKEKRVLLVGAGGAARAIGFLLKKRGADIFIVNRSPERGQALAKFLKGRFISLKEAKEMDIHVLINTTPLGMVPDINDSPVPEELLKPEMVVMDIIYNPLETMLLKMAKRRHCIIIPGIEMFLQQGVEQFRLWTGVEPPLAIMRTVVLKALKNNIH